MFTSDEIAAHVLDLGEDEYWATDAATFFPREHRLLEMDFTGIAVNAPRRIPVAHRERLPLVVATRASGARDWMVQIRDNSALVGTDLASGEVRFASAFKTDEELRQRGSPPRPPRDNPPPDLARPYCEIAPIDARARLGIPWDTGLWSLGLLYCDWPSNTTVTQLDGPHRLRSVRARPVHPMPEPAGDPALPSYLPGAPMLPCPDAGVAFDLDYHLHEGRQRLLVRGAFAIPVRDWHLSGEPVVHTLANGRQEPLAAVVPMTLALMTLDSDAPVRFDWAVPVYGSPLQLGMIARGCFALDALALGRRSLRLAAHFGYVIADGRIFGPRTVHVTEAAPPTDRE